MKFFRGVLYFMLGMFGTEWIKFTYYLSEEFRNLTAIGLHEILPIYYLLNICVILIVGFLSISPSVQEKNSEVKDESK